MCRPAGHLAVATVVRAASAGGVRQPGGGCAAQRSSGGGDRRGRLARAPPSAVCSAARLDRPLDRVACPCRASVDGSRSPADPVSGAARAEHRQCPRTALPHTRSLPSHPSHLRGQRTFGRDRAGAWRSGDRPLDRANGPSTRSLRTAVRQLIRLTRAGPGTRALRRGRKASEVAAAGEGLDDTGTRQLVDRESLAAGRLEGADRALRDLQAVAGLPAARCEVA